MPPGYYNAELLVILCSLAFMFISLALSLDFFLFLSCLPLSVASSSASPPLYSIPLYSERTGTGRNPSLPP